MDREREALMERIAEKIGVWKPRQKCDRGNPTSEHGGWRFDGNDYRCLACDTFVPFTYDDRNRGFPRVFEHDIPCPDLRQPQYVVAMLEWLLDRPVYEFHHLCLTHTPSGWYATEQTPSESLADALMLAIDSLQDRAAGLDSATMRRIFGNTIGG